MYKMIDLKSLIKATVMVELIELKIKYEKPGVGDSVGSDVVGCDVVGRSSADI